MNYLSILEQHLKEALMMNDVLSAIECADAWLSTDPGYLDLRLVLAQLHLRVHGSRQATAHLREALERSIARGELWRAVAAQRWLDRIEASPGSDIAYAKIHRAVTSPDPSMVTNRTRRMAGQLRELGADRFGEFCRALQPVALQMNARWRGEASGNDGLIVAWGSLTVEWTESQVAISEGEPVRVPAAEVDFAAATETGFLHLPGETFRRLSASLPKLETFFQDPRALTGHSDPPSVAGAIPGSPQETEALREAFEGQMGEEGRQLRDIWFAIREGKS